MLLPLYPQFSTTTTASSLAAWRARGDSGSALSAPTRAHPLLSRRDRALSRRWRPRSGEALDAARAETQPIRLLLSAHGLPEKIVRAGDPYPREVETTAAALRAARCEPARVSIGAVCYQSRVGPLAWLGPSVEEELRRAGRDRVGVVVVPISFVSEHSETLVELDRDYRRRRGTAAACRPIAGCRRSAPTRGSSPRWPSWCAALVRGAEARPKLA